MNDLSGSGKFVVGQLHTAMNQVGQSQTAPFETEDSSDSYNDRFTADS